MNVRTPGGDGPGVRLRRLRWWDLPAVLPLEAELFAGWAWSAETFWSELAALGRWYVVAVADGPPAAGPEPAAGRSGAPVEEVLGYAGLAAAGPQADVQTVAVAPGAQGRGVGSVLVSALVAEAARRGCTSLMLEVRADNDPAIRLYGRHGFERIAVRRRYYQPGDVDAHIMRLRPVATAPVQD